MSASLTPDAFAIPDVVIEPKSFVLRRPLRPFASFSLPGGDELPLNGLISLGFAFVWAFFNLLTLCDSETDFENIRFE